jgi:hypothetical protein
MHRCRWEDNIKMGVTEISFDGVNWIHLARDMYQWLIKLAIIFGLYNKGTFLNQMSGYQFLINKSASSN